MTDAESVPAQELNLGGAKGSSIKWLAGPAQGANNFELLWWRHSGFSMHNAVRIGAQDADSRREERYRTPLRR